jgi:hypothetical protein
LKDAPLGLAPALLTNKRLCLEGLPITNTSLFGSFLSDGEKSFMTLAAGVKTNFLSRN